MKKFSKILMTVALTLFVAGSAFAQDMTQATEAYNKAAEAFKAGNEQEAITGFKAAMKIAETAGEEGKTMVADCKGLIPKIYLQEATKKITAKNYASAVEELATTASVAKEYGNTEVEQNANDLIPQVYMYIGDGALNGSKFEEAVAAYENAAKFNPNDGNCFLRMGIAYSQMNKDTEAIAAFEKAKANGQEAAANQQLSRMYLVNLQNAYQSKKYSEAVEAAEKVNAIEPNAQASLIGGLSAYNMKSYSKAISMFKKASQGAQTYYLLADSYEKSGQKASACIYYKKLVSDSKFGAYAKSKITALKCK